MAQRSGIKIFLFLLLFGAGFGAGFLVFAKPAVSDTTNQKAAIENNGGGDEERLNGHYTFINPLLECNNGPDYLSTKLLSFKSDISDLVDNLEEKGTIKYAAVYFRDLNNGPWFGINEREQFYPASLLKTPVVMGILKAAETDPSILDKKLKLDKGEKNPQKHFFQPTRSVQVGKEYSIADLLDLATTVSDNDAASLLLQFLGLDREATVYRDLGLSPPNHFDVRNSISVQGYSSFFRILFNASYLSQEMSERALAMLSRSEFKDGLVAGLPEGVSVAHKFGEFSYKDADGTSESQLHDCGVVYYPKKPYLICIMTRGDSFPNLAQGIKEISKAVYEAVDKQIGGGN